jgi:hypothetical protein
MSETIQTSSEFEYQAFQEASDSGHVFIAGPFDVSFIVQACQGSGLSREATLFSKDSQATVIYEEPQAEE